MTENYLNHLINRLNKGFLNDIYIRPLSKSVDFAKIFTEKLKMSDKLRTSDLIPYKLYCIKNDENKYVAIVLDMNNDLHWFVKKQYRKQGFLTKALNDTILQHLALDEREQQRITISQNAIGKVNFIASERVALKTGFIKTDNNENEYIRSFDDINEFNEGFNSPLSDDELQKLTLKINYYAKQLIRIQTELEIRYGSENIEIDDTINGFKELIYELRKYAIKIEDIGFQSK